MNTVRCSAAGGHDARLAFHSIFSRAAISTPRLYSTANESPQVRQPGNVSDVGPHRRRSDRFRLYDDLLDRPGMRNDDHKNTFEKLLKKSKDGSNTATSNDDHNNTFKRLLRKSKDGSNTTTSPPPPPVQRWKRRKDGSNTATSPPPPPPPVQRWKTRMMKMSRYIRDKHVPYKNPLKQEMPPAQLWKPRMMKMSQYIRDNKHAPYKNPSEQEMAKDDRAKMYKSLDYVGLEIQLEVSCADPPLPIPWAQSLEKWKTASASHILDLEIQQFADHMTPTREEKSALYNVYSSMAGIMDSKVYTSNEFVIYPYGSYKNELWMPYSDIDIGVCYSEEAKSRGLQDGDKKHRPNRLGFLYNRLCSGHASNRFACLTFREDPHRILTVMHIASGIQVQITENVMPGRQSIHVLEWTGTIRNIRLVYTVVRTMLGERGLVDPFTGGISSYGLFMMIVAALKNRKTPKHVHESVSSQLLYVLDFWSKFDTTVSSISFTRNPKTVKIDKKTPFEQAQKLPRSVTKDGVEAAHRNDDDEQAGKHRGIRVTRPRQPYLLCMQDPANDSNDLGKSCHAIKHIQKTIQRLNRDLRASMKDHDAHQRAASKQPHELGIEPNRLPAEGTSLLLPLVGRCHEVYAERRALVQQYGERNLAKWYKSIS
ncbi:hypothetical protein Q7P37_005052 [Cladosporium fusiforme]